VWPNLMYFPIIFVEELRKTTKISVGQDSQVSQLGLELGISLYNSEMLPLDLTFMSSTQYLSITWQRERIFFCHHM
jgi:hypothetical protein